MTLNQLRAKSWFQRT